MRIRGRLGESASELAARHWGLLKFLAISSVALLLLPLSHAAPTGNPPAPPDGASLGNETCAPCHAGIVKSYSTTAMARGSGSAVEGLVPGEFFHKPSGVRYRTYVEGGRAWMSFDRATEPRIAGKRELLYYIGSNRKGRTYLFSVDDFWFEAPINWYSQAGRWNMAPAYTEAHQIPMALPAVMDCLNCHTSGAGPPIPGTENKFAGKPFAHDGVTCERCHGPGAAHAAGHGSIVNPAKLSPERRDAICMECHFEGTVAFPRRRHHVYDFRPGDNLFEYIRYFVLTGTQSASPLALNQVQALASSVCKQKSGDRMSCTSCHDPHVEPLPADKVAFYRGKCIGCHTEAFAVRHHPDKADCTGCHMPVLPSKEVAHTQATDHRIPRRPNAAALLEVETRQRLVPYPETQPAEIRELALAWEALAERNVEGALANAQRLLKQAIAAEPDDPVLLTAMAYVEQKQGAEANARELYERALRADPLAITAALNLGVLQAQQGRASRAVELWQGAFARAPYRSAIGMNLAAVLCESGQPKAARDYVARVLEFNPDLLPAMRLLQRLQSDPPRCKP
ncbi:MAG: tetratricopeptide repeat protein [Acidobacteriaceae bacterium]|nr:tetratricopeptide repeat protein [Acidobacteriaceae bacterium]